MYYIIVFLYGLLFGSFLNVCIYRIPVNKSIASPPSACPYCGYQLKWYDNIPVISFIMLGGKCRNCKKGISIRYPMIEMLTGLVAVCLYDYYGFSFEFFFVSAIAFILIVISFIDIDHKLIPNKIVLLVFAIGIFYEIIVRPVPLLEAFIGVFAASVPLLIIAILSRGGIGGGDIKLMAAVGIFLGWKNALIAMFIGAIIGAIIGTIGIILKKKNRKDVIPFGPFLCTGILVANVYGQRLLEWYLNLINISY